MSPVPWHYCWATFPLSPSLTAQRTNLLQTLLISTVKELGEAGQNHRFGYGRIDVLRALGYAIDLEYGPPPEGQSRPAPDKSRSSRGQANR